MLNPCIWGFWLHFGALCEETMLTKCDSGCDHREDMGETWRILFDYKVRISNVSTSYFANNSGGSSEAQMFWWTQICKASMIQYCRYMTPWHRITLRSVFSGFLLPKTDRKRNFTFSTVWYLSILGEDCDSDRKRWSSHWSPQILSVEFWIGMTLPK